MFVNQDNNAINTDMNPVLNPYAPGAGTPPPELAGRDALRETVRIAVERARLMRPAKGVLLTGLRGVGKTVLLDRFRQDAEAKGIHTFWAEAPEGRSLPALLAPQLRQAMLRLSRNEQARALAERALRGLAGFAKALKVKYNDIEVGFDFDPEPGLADSGDLEYDLQSLIEVAGMTAKSAGTALVMFVDEMQYVEEPELAALITALHRTTQRSLPVMLIGAGLPQLPGRMGRAKSYAERLFEFTAIGPLSEDASGVAIAKPAAALGVEIGGDVLRRIFEETQGYPYFLQEWGKHIWDAAGQSPIVLADLEIASITAVAALDESFFRVRFDRLTVAEKRYLRAMAALGSGPHRSGDVVDKLRRNVTALGPTRSQLIAKGMIWSPNHGDTAFTVPLFDAFLRRILPDEDIED